MAKQYTVFVDCSATMKYVVDAENADDACEKVEEMTQNADFFEMFRKVCEIWNPVVCDTVMDMENNSFVDRYQGGGDEE